VDGASTASDHIEPFPNDFWKLLVADPVIFRVSHLKGVSFLGDEHSTDLGAVATRGLVSDQSTSAFPDSSARFHRKVIILDFDHDTVWKTAPPSVLKLMMDWPDPKISVPSWRVRVKPVFVGRHRRSKADGQLDHWVWKVEPVRSLVATVVSDILIRSSSSGSDSYFRSKRVF
jgi:hypothetical protein